MTARPFAGFNKGFRVSTLVWNLVIDGLIPPETSIAKHPEYADDPGGYAQNILGVNWWAKQKEIAEALVKHQKVFVLACHGIGKTHLAGGLVNWHYDCYNPSITKTTAPSSRQVKALTWKEVRLQRHGIDMLPKAPKIEDALNVAHFAEGYTARDADSFQGDHEEAMLILFEEAVGIAEEFWTAADGMLSSGPLNRWLAIMNPTDTASYAYQEYLANNWHVIEISAFEHPNIIAELYGQPRPYPKAISLKWVEERLALWCQKLTKHDRIRPELDFAWPPLIHANKLSVDPVWYRPDVRFEGRVLGRWPSSNATGVWSDGLFRLACEKKLRVQALSLKEGIQIGCDVARFGDDETTIHVRRGGVSLYHESYNGKDTAHTAGRLKELCGEFAALSNESKYTIPCLIDDDGVGGGVVDQADGFNFVGIGAGSKAFEEENYPNRRSELWFATAERAQEERLDLSLLDQVSRDKLRRQLLAPTWRQDSKGRRVVEAKEKTKKRIKRSPDDADAFNLAYASYYTGPQVLVGGNRDQQFSA